MTATLSSLPASRTPRASTMAHAALFVAGFSLIFIVGWGGAATILGQLFGQYKFVIGKAGGVIVVLLGLVTIGVVRVPWLLVDTRPQRTRWGPHRIANSVVFGMLFAAGWTPCIGVTLGAILTLGFSQQTAYQGMILASGYALGLGIPFLILAGLLDRALGFVRKMGRYVRHFQVASGAFLILIGLMMLTDQITQIAIWAQRNGLYLDLALGAASAPTYLAAVAAGTLSFLSPCVLPLVPAYMGFLTGQTALGANGRA